jgi:HPt (histidine-containing phosphotransfer) domain-containing protein
MLGPDRLTALLTRLESQLTSPASEELLDGSDLQALADHGHTIISAAGMLGFADLSRAARLLEDACREGAGIDAARDAFRESRSIALVHIEALLTGLHEKAARTGTRRRA